VSWFVLAAPDASALTASPSADTGSAGSFARRSAHTPDITCLLTNATSSSGVLHWSASRSRGTQQRRSSSVTTSSNSDDAKPRQLVSGCAPPVVTAGVDPDPRPGPHTASTTSVNSSRVNTPGGTSSTMDERGLLRRAGTLRCWGAPWSRCPGPRSILPCAAARPAPGGHRQRRPQGHGPVVESAALPSGHCARAAQSRGTHRRPAPSGPAAAHQQQRPTRSRAGAARPS
jgi:hypothetical protein